MHGPNGRHAWRPFNAAAYALFVLLLGSNLPTPLFPLYAKTYGLSPLGVTLLFATYTLLVIPAILLFGPLSDAKGRREVLTVALVTAGLAAGMFAAADSVLMLFAAQAVQALALGALQGTAAPTLVEQDPSGQRRRASAIASALTVGGAAAGPLLAGLLAQYAAMPLRLAYLVEIALLAVALAGVLALLPRCRERRRWRPRRPTVPRQIRRQFTIAGISAFVAWAVTGLFLSLIPSFVTTVLGDGVAVAGAIVALLLGSSAATQFAGHRLESLRAQTAGLLAMCAGVLLLAFADSARDLPLLIVATIPAGIGQGLAFMGSLGDVNEIAPEDRKGDTVASYYVVVYIGTALPAIGVGALAGHIGLPDAVQVFAYVVIAICLAGLLALGSERRRALEPT
jgi:MFS family permease